jgi:multisubunit Na+/H+ antiporter MnhC subunit
LRKILAFNLVGSGVFLIFRAIARRGASLGLGGDPVPQALVITAIVVAAVAGRLIAIILSADHFSRIREKWLFEGAKGFDTGLGGIQSSCE